MPVLVATDFSDNSAAAVRVASRRAARSGDSLTLLHCLESAVDDTPWRHLLEMPQNMRARFWKAGKKRLEEMFEETIPAEDRPHVVDYRVEFKYAEDGILDVLDEEDFNLVVLGATGQNRLANFLLGSTTEDVVRRSDVPVLVVPSDVPEDGFETLVAPVDFTECSRHSLARAASIARQDDARLVIVHAYVLPVTETTFMPAQMPPETIDAFEQQRERQLDEVIETVDLDGIEWEGRLEVGTPHNAIVDTVEDVDADLVVMGTHGRRGFERLFLGSTATKVLRRMPCSVMTIREHDVESND